MNTIERLEAELRMIVRHYLDYLADNDSDEAVRERMYLLMWLTAYVHNIDEAELTSDANIQRAVCDIDYDS